MVQVKLEFLPKIFKILSRKYSIQVLDQIGSRDIAHWTELEKIIPRGHLLHLVREQGKLGLIEKLYAPQTKKPTGYRITDLGKHLLTKCVHDLTDG